VESKNPNQYRKPKAERPKISLPNAAEKLAVESIWRKEGGTSKPSGLEVQAMGLKKVLPAEAQAKYDAADNLTSKQVRNLERKLRRRYAM